MQGLANIICFSTSSGRQWTFCWTLVSTHQVLPTCIYEIGLGVKHIQSNHICSNLGMNQATTCQRPMFILADFMHTCCLTTGLMADTTVLSQFWSILMWSKESKPSIIKEQLLFECEIQPKNVLNARWNSTTPQKLRNKKNKPISH